MRHSQSGVVDRSANNGISPTRETDDVKKKVSADPEYFRRKSADVLLDVLLLSRCTYLVQSASGVAEFAHYFSPTSREHSTVLNSSAIGSTARAGSAGTGTGDVGRLHEHSTHLQYSKGRAEPRWLLSETQLQQARTDAVRAHLDSVKGWAEDGVERIDMDKGSAAIGIEGTSTVAEAQPLISGGAAVMTQTDQLEAEVIDNSVLTTNATDISVAVHFNPRAADMYSHLQCRIAQQKRSSEAEVSVGSPSTWANNHAAGQYEGQCAGDAVMQSRVWLPSAEYLRIQLMHQERQKLENGDRSARASSLEGVRAYIRSLCRLSHVEVEVEEKKEEERHGVECDLAGSSPGAATLCRAETFSPSHSHPHPPVRKSTKTSRRFAALLEEEQQRVQVIGLWENSV